MASVIYGRWQRTKIRAVEKICWQYGGLWDIMKDRKDRNVDLRFGIRVMYSAFLIAILIITVLICLRAPVQRHFKNIGKNDVWFGEDWYYTGESEKVTSHKQHYLEIHTKDDSVSITKTLDFTPTPEEYLCFRARALDTVVYVNGKVWYSYYFREEYRSHSKRMYMLHQVPAAGMKAGDTITIELGNETGGENSTVQFMAVGDRYALVRYILSRAKNSLIICLAALVLIILNLIASHSAILIDKLRDVRPLKWLTLFLLLSVIYLATDSGCLEIFIERISIVSWLKDISMLMLPIPFILFVEYAFFPGHMRYEVLAFVNLIVAVVSVVFFVIFAKNMSDFYICVHVLIAIDIGACILSSVQEKLVPSAEVILGFSAVVITTALSIAFYWNEVIYPCSIAFGYGLLIFSVCMLVWIVRSRDELNRMREEADHVIMEREKMAAEEASEQKSRFLSHMSHEIRSTRFLD